MVEIAPHVFEVEFRRVKRTARVCLLALIAVPLFYYGPLLWNDGSYAGRWEFAPDLVARPVMCNGVPHIMQHCEVTFGDSKNSGFMKRQYLVFAMDWNRATPDIVRNGVGQFSNSIAVSANGLMSRIGALFVLLLLGLMIERLALAFYWRGVLNRPSLIVAPTEQSKETVMLSRDRRDHF